MAKQSKGQKYGRNRDRNPSSKLQRARTERNKARKIKAAGTAVLPAGGKPHRSPGKPLPLSFVVFSGLVQNYAGQPLYLSFVDSVLVDISPRAPSGGNSSFSHCATSVEKLNPLTGQRTLISHSPAR